MKHSNKSTTRRRKAKDDKKQGAEEKLRESPSIVRATKREWARVMYEGAGPGERLENIEDFHREADARTSGRPFLLARPVISLRPSRRRWIASKSGLAPWFASGYSSRNTPSSPHSLFKRSNMINSRLIKHQS